MDSLIFNRTINDVVNHTNIGQYKAEDLNRVESWCYYLANKLTTYGYSVSITTKTNWTMYDMRTSSEMERVRKNVKKIADAFYSFTKITPSMNNFDFNKANNIEKILYEVDELLTKMIANFYFSNEVYAGEV